MWNKRIVLLLLVIIAAGLHAESPRTIKGVSRVEDFRPVGDRRLWTFVSKDSVFGQLVSGVKEKTVVDGEEALVLEGGMRVDFRQMGGQAVSAIHSEYKVSVQGCFLEDNLTFQLPENRSEEYRFSRKGTSLEGYYTRGGTNVEQTIPWPKPYYAFDGNFVDQLELYLATRDLTEGAYISDTLFVPQLLSFTSLTAQAGAVEWRELWKGKFDSVIGIHFTEPQRMSAFMTLDHRLIRLDFPGQQYRVFQDVVKQAPVPGQPAATPKEAPQRGTISYIALAAQYFAYGVVAALVLLLVAAKAYRWPDSYVGLLFGAIVFGLVLITQIPAQKFVVTKILIPGLRQGDTLYFLGLLPALVGGIVQECLKLLGIYAVQYHRQPSAMRLVLVGGFVAAAFGVAEACYLVEPTTLLSWQLFERSSRICYHIASGVVLGVALGSESQKKIALFGGLVTINSLMLYLPVFAQRALFSPRSLHFALAGIALLSLMAAVVLSKTFRPPAKPLLPVPPPAPDAVKP
jgi:hypothetical protein